MTEDAIIKLIDVRSNHPVQVKKTKEAFNEVFDYMVKVDGMSMEEEEAHRNYEEEKLMKNLGLEYIDKLLDTGGGLLAEVMMTENEWKEST